MNDKSMMWRVAKIVKDTFNNDPMRGNKKLHELTDTTNYKGQLRVRKG